MSALQDGLGHDPSVIYARACIANRRSEQFADTLRHAPLCPSGLLQVTPRPSDDIPSCVWTMMTRARVPRASHPTLGVMDFIRRIRSARLHPHRRCDKASRYRWLSWYRGFIVVAIATPRDAIDLRTRDRPRDSRRRPYDVACNFRSDEFALSRMRGIRVKARAFDFYDVVRAARDLGTTCNRGNIHENLIFRRFLSFPLMKIAR